MKARMKTDLQQLKEAKAISMSTFAIDAKLPADPTTFTPSFRNMISSANQSRNKNAIKGAVIYSSSPFDLSLPSSFGKGAHGQSIYYSGLQREKIPAAPDLIGYAATQKDDNFIRRDKDLHDEEVNTLAVWFRVAKNAHVCAFLETLHQCHGINTNNPDLSTICKNIWCQSICKIRFHGII